MEDYNETINSTQFFDYKEIFNNEDKPKTDFEN